MKLPPFQQLVDEHWQDVARLAAALAGAQDGPDVAQQAWMQALSAYPALQHGSNLRSWLLTITARVAADHHRHRGRSPVSVEDPLRLSSEDPARADDALWAHVRSLSERQRTAIALRYALDLSHPEMARQLGTTQAASRRLVSDGLKALRQKLAADRWEELR